MANSNFIVQNGLTVGSTVIDAASGNITLPSGSAIYVGSAAVTPGGTSNFSSEVITGNSTVNALTVNNSATIGTTLGLASGGLVLDGSAATISSTSTTITIDPATSGVGGQVVVAGNLYVTGTTFTVDSQTITVNDKDIVVANNQTTSAGIDGAGIIAGNTSVGGGIAKFIYNNATTSWQSNVAVTPSANATLAFGGASNYWGTGYFNAIQAPSITGVLQTAAQTNITSVGTLTAVTVSGTSTLNGTVTLNNILPSANANANIGSTSSQFNTIFAKATSAQYADLAEKYLADAEYAPGTVVVFGGDKEITISNQTHDNRVAGVVSTNPAYLMNTGLSTGTPVAFTGRVPCRVMGPVYKGQPLVQGMNWGIAEGLNPDYFTPGCVLGKALEEITDNSIKTIEVVVGRF